MMYDPIIQRSRCPAEHDTPSRWLRSTITFDDPERIEHHRAKPGDIAIVTGHESQAIGQCRRRKQTVNDRNRSDRTHTAPSVRYGIVNTEHPSVEDDLEMP
jgi:hypothetical protein